MTEPRLRDLYTWVDAHRFTLVQHAGALAEIASWIRDRNVNPRMLEQIETRCDRIAFELAAALEALERIHPREPDVDEDTIPDCLKDLIK